jgi:hypothetical protein
VNELASNNHVLIVLDCLKPLIVAFEVIEHFTLKYFEVLLSLWYIDYFLILVYLFNGMLVSE